jgi:hypothetical protein
MTDGPRWDDPAVRLFGSHSGERPRETVPSSRTNADPPASHTEVGVHQELPLALVARSMLSSAVDSVLVFDTSRTRCGAVGRLTWRELVWAVAVGADPQVATAADFMIDTGLVEDPFWAASRDPRDT